MMIEIETNQPVPIDKRPGNNPAGREGIKYPLASMAVGDSFWLSYDRAQVATIRKKITDRVIKEQAKGRIVKFSTRSQSKDGRDNNKVNKNQRGLRVWRVK